MEKKHNTTFRNFKKNHGHDNYVILELVSYPDVKYLQIGSSSSSTHNLKTF